MIKPGLIALIVTLLAYLTAQTIKGFFQKNKSFFTYGGNPSTHAASCAAFSTSVFLLEGPSLVFALSLLLTVIVVSDAVKLRQPVGQIATAVNKAHKTQLPESLGHTSFQVLTGLILGILIALLMLL